MPFSANDTVDILIKARAEGTEQIKAMDTAAKGANTTFKDQETILKTLNSTLLTATKSIDSLAAAIEKTKISTKGAGSELSDFDKALKTIISNPAYSVNSPFALLGRTAQQLTTALGPTGIAIGATAVGLGVLTVAAFGLVSSMGQGARELQNFALRLDISVAQAQKLSIAAKLTGVNINSLEQAARLLGNALDDPAGSGKKQVAALERLGVATYDATGQQREMGEVVLDTLDKLSNLSSAAEKAHLGQVLLGRSSKELIPLIDQYQELSNIFLSL